jgi:hypothetical protein
MSTISNCVSISTAELREISKNLIFSCFDFLADPSAKLLQTEIAARLTWFTIRNRSFRWEILSNRVNFFDEF